jgi:hypothetical protein
MTSYHQTKQRRYPKYPGGPKIDAAKYADKATAPRLVGDVVSS